ncbi:MAG: hypothetical protein ACE5GR_07820 [Nitrosopumilus sp.]
MRGISELLSVVILTVVIISGSLVFTNLSHQRIFTNSQSVSEALDESKKQASELIGKISLSKDVQKSNLFLINYGNDDISIDQVFVDNVLNSASIEVTSVDNKTSFGNILPSLGSNSTVNLHVDKPYQSKIILVTDSGNSYTFFP